MAYQINRLHRALRSRTQITLFSNSAAMERLTLGGSAILSQPSQMQVLCRFQRASPRYDPNRRLDSHDSKVYFAQSPFQSTMHSKLSGCLARSSQNCHTRRLQLVASSNHRSRWGMQSNFFRSFNNHSRKKQLPFSGIVQVA